MRLLRTSLLGLALVFCALPAFGNDEAKRVFRAGNQAYSAGEYLAAARAYEHAYELYPGPSITFSIAQAYRRHYFEDPDVEWLVRARALYRRYLTEQPSGGRRAHAVTHLGNIELLLASRERSEQVEEAPRPAPATELLIASATPHAVALVDGARSRSVPVVAKVKPGKHRVKLSAPGYFDSEIEVVASDGRLTVVPLELAPRPGSLEVVAPEASDVTIDGRFVARTPLTAPIALRQGVHWVSITSRGRRPVSRSVKIARGERQVVEVALEPSDQRVAAYWTLGGAGAFFLAGSVTAVLAIVAENDARDARSGLSEGRALTPEERSDSNRALTRRDRYRTLSIAGFGVSALAGLTGVGLWVFDSPTAEPQRSGSYGVRYRGAF